MNTNGIEPIVKKYAQYGLNEAKQSTELFHKWLDVWSMGLVGEIGEAYKYLGFEKAQELQAEIADICWYSIALDLLLEKTYCQNVELKEVSRNFSIGEKKTTMVSSLIKATEFLETVKKYRRDYPKRDINSILGYEKPLLTLSGVFDFSETPQILEEKLGKRYPNGFNPTDSINRDNPGGQQVFPAL